MQQEILQDHRLGDTFIGEMCTNLLVPLLWNSITTKHRAYEPEHAILNKSRSEANIYWSMTTTSDAGAFSASLFTSFP